MIGRLGAAVPLLLALWLAGCQREAVGVTATAPLLRLDGETEDVLRPGSDQTIAFVFVSTHCPISNRYAPTLSALARDAGPAEYVALVYPDPDDDPEKIAAHQAAYGLDLPTFRDPEHHLVGWTGATVTPEAAVVRRTSSGPELTYVGRIDDRAVSFGTFRPEASTHDLAVAVAKTGRGEDGLERTKAVGCYIADLR